MEGPLEFDEIGHASKHPWCSEGAESPPKPTPPPAPVRIYTRGDSSRPFESRYPGTCHHCAIGYDVGDLICMVTIADGEKGKAVHEECVSDIKEFMRKMDMPDQSDEPPF